jgi:penicillin-binding protein 1A
MAKVQTTNTKKTRKRWFFKTKGFWFAILLLLCGVVALAVVGWRFFDEFTRDYRARAETYDLKRINDLEIPSLIVDRNGKEIGRIFVQNRSVILIADVPKIFIDALHAGEDQRFDTHDGVDYIGVVRAAYLNWKAGETTQGASTITQQLARNAYDLEGERRKYNESGLQRKMVEAFLARRIEKRYKKHEILEFYLNRIYFGSGYYGIRSASLGYFGKEPVNLTALESAAIVGCIKNPSNLSPINNPEGNRGSRNLVLGRMVDLHAISSKEAMRLSSEVLKLNPRPLRRGTTHLYERVAEAVGKALGEDALASGGFTVHTTILAEAQEAAQTSLLESLAQAETRPGYRRQKYRDYRKTDPNPAEYLQGACLMVDHESGEVLAHVGGRDYAQVPYDFIEAGKRPLGTAFFPFIYAAALEAGLTPATLVEDEPMDNRSVMVGGREGILGEWGMEVSSPVYQGKIPLRTALEQSKIAATVRVTDQTGLKRVVDSACAFGFPLQKAELLRRLAVGFEEVSMKQAVRAMSVFALGGKMGPADLVYVDRVETPTGRVIFRRPEKERPKTGVIDGATAWQVHGMMAGSLYRGSSKGVLENLLEKPFNGAGKGGTSHDFGDCWFLGYNQRVTCGVWAGFLNANGEPIYPGAFSRDLTMPVWQAAMNAATPSFGGGTITPPTNVLKVPICSVSGQRATQFCQEYAEDAGTGVVRSRSTAVQEYFRRGTEQLPFCAIHSGANSDGSTTDMTALNLPALDAVPVQPKSPALLGDDPYHTELPSFAATTAEPGVVRRRTNVLDSLDLGDVEESLPLKSPQRLQIEDE